MKKIIAIAITLILIVSLTVSVSAATTGKWDFSAGQKHVNQTVTRMIQGQYQSAEATTTYNLSSWFNWCK